MSLDDVSAPEATSAKPSDKTPKPEQSWAEELERLHRRLEHLHRDVDVRKTYLVPEWDDGPGGTKRWQSLRNERDRIGLIQIELGWLSIDAVARVDRCLKGAGGTIDAKIDGSVSQAARQLRHAEHLMQRAWWSRHCNSWSAPRILPWWLWLAGGMLAALGLTAWAIVDQELFPRGQPIELREALFAAALWGFAGALVNGLRTIHHRVQGQEFERERVAWYLLSPIIGLAFGAIAFLLFLSGLLSTGQDLTSEAAPAVVESAAALAQPVEAAQEQADAASMVVDPTPIIVLALLAGFAQNAFLGGLQQIIRARFRGAVEEEETPV